LTFSKIDGVVDQLGLLFVRDRAGRGPGGLVWGAEPFPLLDISQNVDPGIIQELMLLEQLVPVDFGIVVHRASDSAQPGKFFQVAEFGGFRSLDKETMSLEAVRIKLIKFPDMVQRELGEVIRSDGIPMSVDFSILVCGKGRNAGSEEQCVQRSFTQQCMNQFWVKSLPVSGGNVELDVDWEGVSNRDGGRESVAHVVWQELRSSMRCFFAAEL
jgi:hypothetical protein